MYSHAVYCGSGDNTLAAGIRAVGTRMNLPRTASEDPKSPWLCFASLIVMTLLLCVQVHNVVGEEGDDYFVFLISDANLSAYGVSPSALAKALLDDSRVHSYCIFIANEVEAETMKTMMPAGRAHVVLDTRELPTLFRQIFSSAVVQ